MNSKYIIIFYILIFELIEVNCLAHPQLPPGFILEEVTSSLAQPTAMVFAPDGRLFITEKSGNIRIIENGILLDQPFYSVKTQTPNERGLAGIVLDPDFDNNQFVYIFYTLPNEPQNIVARITAAGNTAIPGSETELIRSDPMWASWHNGGGMVFDKEGRLIVGFGDGTAGPSATSLDNINGSIVRINSDGSIPIDNPFIDKTENKYQSIIAYGIRNPYNIAVNKNGRIFFNDVGNVEYEEINELFLGRNYGWGWFEGPLNGSPPDENYLDPIYYYNHDEDRCAITGAAFYEPKTITFPEKYLGNYFFMEYCKAEIWTMNPETNEVEIFASGFERPNFLSISENGELFLLQIKTGQLFKISYVGDGQPYIFRNLQSLTVPSGSTVNFEFEVNGEGVLQFKWYRNNIFFGSTNLPLLRIENIALQDDGSEFFCVVSNLFGNDTTNIGKLTVVDGEYPAVDILEPDNNYQYSAGDNILFKGSVIDKREGILPPSVFKWFIDFHHDEHIHPALDPISGVTSGSYIVPQFGEVDTNVFYNIYLEAQNSSGLKTISSKKVQPRIVSMYLNSEPNGIQINIDGASQQTPYHLRSLNHLKRVIEAPLYDIVDGNLYSFNYWDDSETNDRMRVFTAKDGVNINAVYTDEGPFYTGNASGLNVDFFVGIEENRKFYKSSTRENVNENWDILSPYFWNGDFPNDSFSVKWSGSFVAPIDGEYTFYLLHDGIVSLTLGETSLFNNLRDASNLNVADSASVFLLGGNRYPFELDYKHIDYVSRVHLFYSINAISKEIIPPSQFEKDIVDSINETDSCFFIIRPNPIDAFINIVASRNNCSNQINSVVIYDEYGRLIKTEKGGNLITENYQITFDNYVPGIYFLQLNFENKVVIKKIVVTS